MTTRGGTLILDETLDARLKTKSIPIALGMLMAAC